MEAFSMTSTFIDGSGREVKRRGAKQFSQTLAHATGKCGDPGMIRTCDKQFRKLLLYPPELRGHNRGYGVLRYRLNQRYFTSPRRQTAKEHLNCAQAG